MLYTRMVGSYYPDTHPEVEALQGRNLREMPPWRKAELLTALVRSSHQLALAGLRHRYPQAEPAEIKLRYAGLLLGEEVASKFYGKLHTKP
ncbi:MAG: hypothetical protein KIS88_02200 [Anaerolineales bacterium]|nr:hypothetical protein [Anaerolineales bacterium]